MKHPFRLARIRGGVAVGIGTAVLTLPVAGTAVVYAAGIVGGGSSANDTSTRTSNAIKAAPPTSIPGDNGDFKTHNPGTAESDQRDEPQVCTFYLDAFHFDGLQSISWDIQAWPPTGNKNVVKTGTTTLDANGHGRDPASPSTYSLPDGHYKVHWVIGGAHGKDKYKEFWVKCVSPTTPPPTTVPPTTVPPTTVPPTTVPPTTVPPTTVPPTTEPPTTEPPTTEPPTKEPTTTKSIEPTTEKSTSPTKEPSKEPTTEKTTKPKPTTPASSKSTSSEPPATSSSSQGNPPATTPVPAPSTTPPGGLAHTGAGGVVELSAIAALLIGAGIFLRKHIAREQRRQH